MRRCSRGLPVVLGLTLAASHAGAHVAPSVDDNNRYLKLTPQGDRVRLAYTVFFGQVPGAQLRPSIDSNRDGAIDDAEAAAFARKLAAEVAAGIELSLDGATHPVAWSQVAAGMGSPRVAAGAFSIDLVAYLCLASPRGKHRVQLRDRFRLLRPGETEVKIEDTPGVKLAYARIGSLADPTLDFRMIGPGGPLADDGLDLAFDASDRAPVASDGVCGAPASSPTGLPSALVIGAGAIAGIGLGAVAALIIRRRRQARP